MHKNHAFVYCAFLGYLPRLTHPTLNILFCLWLRMLFKVRISPILVSYSVFWVSPMYTYKLTFVRFSLDNLCRVNLILRRVRRT